MSVTAGNKKELILDEKTEALVAISAATGANCIPCFEHLYEKAITSGVTLAEIKRASVIAGYVKKGAHLALSSAIDELTGSEEMGERPCQSTVNKSCCG